jgi:hypothetical protein
MNEKSVCRNEQEVIAEAEARREAWFRHFRRWRMTHWVVGIIGVLSSVVAASQKVDDVLLPVAASLSAVCFAIIGFTSSQRRASAYVSAWRLIGTALLRYKAGLIALDAVITAVERGEAAIAEADMTSVHASQMLPPDTK